MTRPAALARPPGFRGAFRTDAPARAAYAEAAGIGRAMPLAVAEPQDGDDVVAVVRAAGLAGVPIIARGSGTSMAGGAIGPGIVVDLGRLAVTWPVDVAQRVVRAGPGALRDRVNEAAEAAGLRFPVDPSSGAYCTVGGMVATNAAGAHSLKYGATRRWVRALECVFADGTRAEVRRGVRPPGLPAVRRALAAVEGWRQRAAGAAAGLRLPGVLKDSSGYALDEFLRSGDLLDLLVGSEGTLALFVRVELALAPVPGGTSSLLAAFPTLEHAVDAAARARTLGAAACELLDRTFLEAAAEGGRVPVPDGSEAVLLAETEGESPAAAADLARRLDRVFRAAGATQVTVALDPRTERVLWQLRHRASPTIARLHPHLRSMQFIEDGAVPPDRLPAYVRGVRAALDRQGVRGVIFGHAGDAHVHVNPLVDVRQPDWRARVEGLLADVAELTHRLGGTMAGEHGDGRLRTPLLATQRGEAAAALYADVKAAFDPEGLLNPGVKVPLPGQTPLAEIKYDPALPPLPPAARRALDRVAAERAYATPRLAMLAACDGDEGGGDETGGGAAAPLPAGSDVEHETG